MKIFSVVMLIPMIPLSLFVFVYTIMMVVGVYKNVRAKDQDAADSNAKAFWGGVCLTLVTFFFSGALLQEVFQ